MIDRRTFLAGTGAVLLAAPLPAEAPQVGWKFEMSMEMCGEIQLFVK